MHFRQETTPKRLNLFIYVETKKIQNGKLKIEYLLVENFTQADIF